MPRDDDSATVAKMAPKAPASADVKSEDESAGDAKDNTTMLYGDVVDEATFDQILEMDDDEEERDFSRSIVYDFFDQAKQTFKDMDEALKEEDFETLSAKGHFLKGSSATLGLTKVKDSCEKIQHLGARKDETGTKDVLDDPKTLAKLKVVIAQAKEEFQEAERKLRGFYGE